MQKKLSNIDRSIDFLHKSSRKKLNSFTDDHQQHKPNTLTYRELEKKISIDNYHHLDIHAV